MYSPIAICVGAIVCIAAANAGNTSQDLKTGYIVGATPLYQQIGLVIGVVTSAFVIGVTLIYLHENLGGIGSANLAAPQATLMSTIIRGLLNQNLPWGLVLVGVFVAVVLELCGIRSLSFAVGSYLPIATTAPIFCGGMVRWWVERKTRPVAGVGRQLRHALQLGAHRWRLDHWHPLRASGRHWRHQRASGAGHVVPLLQSADGGRPARQPCAVWRPRADRGPGRVAKSTNDDVNRLALRVLLIVLVVAGSAWPQAPTRRLTTIDALKQFPGFFHLQSVLLRGEIDDATPRLQLKADEQAIRVLLDEGVATKKGAVEVRGVLIDVGRLEPGDPRVGGFAEGRDADRWPRPGEELFVRVSAVAEVPPSATMATVRAIALEPWKFDTQKVTVIGNFRGRNLFGDLPGAPGKSRYDFVLRGVEGAIWVTNLRPRGSGFELDVNRRVDSDRWIEVSGTIVRERGLVSIDATRLTLAKAPQTTEAPAESAAPAVHARTRAGGLQHADRWRDRCQRVGRHPHSVFSRAERALAGWASARVLRRRACRFEPAVPGHLRRRESCAGVEDDAAIRGVPYREGRDPRRPQSIRRRAGDAAGPSRSQWVDER